MTAYGTSSSVETVPPPPLWVCTLLGIVMIAAGILALSDIMFATIISVKLIGLIVLAVGAFEIIHAFWTKGWGGFLWQILLGALYLAFGLVLLNEPEAGALILTYLLGALLLASGIIRCVLSFAYWGQSGWMMLLSGALSAFLPACSSCSASRTSAAGYWDSCLVSTCFRMAWRGCSTPFDPFERLRDKRGENHECPHTSRLSWFRTRCHRHRGHRRNRRPFH